MKKKQSITLHHCKCMSMRNNESSSKDILSLAGAATTIQPSKVMHWMTDWLTFPSWENLFLLFSQLLLALLCIYVYLEKMTDTEERTKSRMSTQEFMTDPQICIIYRTCNTNFHNTVQRAQKTNRLYLFFVFLGVLPGYFLFFERLLGIIGVNVLIVFFSKTIYSWWLNWL